MKKQEKKASVLLYTEWAGPLRCLPLDDVGRLFLAMMDYTATGEPPVFDSPGAAMAWEFIRMRLDENQEKWEAICQQRQTAGRRGAESTNGKERQKAANPANAAFAEKPAAKPADNENGNGNENDNVNGNENGKTTSSSSVPGEGEGMTTTTIAPEQENARQEGQAPAHPAELNKAEAFWQACGYSDSEGASRAFSVYRQAGMEESLLVQAVREASAHKAKNPLAYTRQVLEEALGSGQLTLAAWQARKRPAGAGLSKRVDRESPSGNDFLADAITRPRRHKRK